MDLQTKFLSTALLLAFCCDPSAFCRDPSPMLVEDLFPAVLLQLSRRIAAENILLLTLHLLSLRISAIIVVPEVMRPTWAHIISGAF